METTIYKPTGCVSLAETLTDPQIRLGIQGSPGSGKTWEALTFPNPIVANFDRGLIAHQGRSDVIEVPFWNGTFCDSIHKRDGIMAPPNRKDAWLVWLAKEASKLVREQTLVVDSNRQIQNAYHTQYKLNPVISNKGKDNKFAEWTQKIDYFAELGTMYKSLKCDVVYICHETEDVDADTGAPNGSVKPMLSGESGRSIASDFTDWFRALAIAKPVSDDAKKRAKDKYHLSDETLKEWINSTSNETIYIWQTQFDEVCKCKTSLVGAPKYVIAHYSTFAKYKRKID